MAMDVISSYTHSRSTQGIIIINIVLIRNREISFAIVIETHCSDLEILTCNMAKQNF